MPSRIMAPHRTRFSTIRDTLRKCFTLLLLKFFCGEIQNWIRTRLSRSTLSRSACLIVTAGLETVSLGVRFRSWFPHPYRAHCHAGANGENVGDVCPQFSPVLRKGGPRKD